MDKTEVRPFIPKPLQCNKCLRYGHTHKRCTNKEVCAVCGSQQHQTNWNCTNPKCINCGLEHHAKSKICDFHIYNTEVKLLMSRTGMSAREAKLELRVRGTADPSKSHSYRTIVNKLQNKNNENQQGENKNNNWEEIPTRNQFQDLEKEEETTEILPLNNLGKPSTSNSRGGDRIEDQLKEMFEDVETENRFGNLGEEETSEEPMVIESENKKRKLPRTPPKPKKANNENEYQPIQTEETEQVEDEGEESKAEVSGNQEVTNEDDNYSSPKMGGAYPKTPSLYHTGGQGEISPSPIIGNPYLRRAPPVEKKKKHDDICGCHDCFSNLCQACKDLTKDKFTILVKNFIRNKRKETSDLETHRQGCMCVNHLINSEKNKIPIADAYIRKLNQPEKRNLKNTSKIQSQIVTKTEQNEYTSSYNKVNSKASTSINYSNLTNLT